MTMLDYCRLETSPPVARLTLAHPPVNVLSLRMVQELAGVLDAVDSAPNVHLLVIEADGDEAFSAGVAVEDHLPDKLDDMIGAFHDFCGRLLGLDAVTIALAGGYALGGAMELLSCCDFVVATDDASFGQPEIELGCFPPLGAALYPSLFGAKRATSLLLLGERVSASEAKELGLVHRVVPKGELRAAGKELLGSLAEKSPVALRLAKKALRHGFTRALEALPDVEALYKEELAASEDMLEGLSAFLEKRKPVWRGK